MKNGLWIWRRGFIGLFALLLWVPDAGAQTALGQPSLEEAKVQIWCAALRYVYDDTSRPPLKNSLRCEAGNLAALAASIRPDSQRVYSLLYQPIEGRGAIYQGKKDDVARLTALTKAIVTKLRASPARRKDPARLARLAALETALTTYVTSGTPPGELAEPATEAEATAPAADSTAPAPALGPAEAAEAEAAAESSAAPAPPRAAAPDAAGSLMSRVFAPLALTLALLSLVLFGLLRANVSRLLRRQQREVSAAAQAAQQAQAAADQTTRATADAAASAAAATATAAQIAAGASAAAKAASELPLSLTRLSPGQRGEVEALIRQHVAAELARRLPTAPKQPDLSVGTGAVAAYVPVEPATDAARSDQPINGPLT